MARARAGRSPAGSRRARHTRRLLCNCERCASGQDREETAPMRRLAALAALIVAVGAAAPADAAPRRAHMSAAKAHAALTKVKQLQHGKGVETGYEMSPALHQLTAALPSLTGDARLQAKSILTRPDDANPDPADTHKWSGLEDSV